MLQSSRKHRRVLKVGVRKFWYTCDEGWIVLYHVADKFSRAMKSRLNSQLLDARIAFHLFLFSFLTDAFPSMRTVFGISRGILKNTRGCRKKIHYWEISHPTTALKMPLLSSNEFIVRKLTEYRDRDGRHGEGKRETRHRGCFMKVSITEHSSKFDTFPRRIARSRVTRRDFWYLTTFRVTVIGLLARPKKLKNLMLSRTSPNPWETSSCEFAESRNNLIAH